MNNERSPGLGLNLPALNVFGDLLKQPPWTTSLTGLIPTISDLIPTISDLIPKVDFGITTHLGSLLEGIRWPGPDLVTTLTPALTQFAEVTSTLDRMLKPVLPDLAFAGDILGAAQGQLFEAVGSGLSPVISVLDSMIGPDLLTSLRSLADQLGEVQHDPDAARAVLDDAGARTPALRPLLDWLRENDSLAQWAGLAFMVIFFAIQQLQGTVPAELVLPPGSVVVVPDGTGRSETATVTIEVPAATSPSGSGTATP